MDFKIIDFKAIGDESRGFLVSLEAEKEIPFALKRVYYISGVGENAIRGEHAHRNLSQVLVPVSGSVDITCESRDKTETFTLNNPAKGLLIEGLVWRTMKNFSKDCVLMVLASDYYSEADYIRDYNTFLEEKIG